MFSTLIVCYLFLGGAGAGVCLVSSALGLLSPGERISKLASRYRGGIHRVFCVPNSYRRLISGGFVAALVVLVVAMVCLAADLGRVDRVVLLLAHPTASFIAVGTYALIACIALTALLAWVWRGFGRWGLKTVRVLEVAAVLAAVTVMVYTGLMLQSLQSVPLWATPWLPVLFALSSLSCGVALLLGVAQVNGATVLFANVVRGLVVVDAVVIVLETAAVIIFVVGVSAASGVLDTSGVMRSPTSLAASNALMDLLSGSNASLFWGGFVVVGLAVPLVLDIAFIRKGRFLPMLVLLAALCVLVGGFVLRFCMVEAGLHPSLMLSVVG